MQKIKNFLKRFLKNDGIIYKAIKKVYHFLSTLKYKMTHNKEVKAEREKYHQRAISAVEKIKEFEGRDYIVFYNPTWLGVAASTLGLFKNNVPLEHIYQKMI